MEKSWSPGGAKDRRGARGRGLRSPGALGLVPERRVSGHREWADLSQMEPRKCCGSLSGLSTRLEKLHATDEGNPCIQWLEDCLESYVSAPDFMLGVSLFCARWTWAYGG